MITKVTLLGDSIRQIGYGTVVPELLGNKYDVYQPNDNGRFAKHTLRGLFDWDPYMQGSKIVHWNNGLWDICDLFGDGCFTTEKEYIDNMLRIAEILTQRYEKVIFATTTPVTTQNKYNRNSDIKRYNDIIVPLLQEKGIIINDLYSLVNSNIDKYIRKDDNIHLTEEGIMVCAKQVTEFIQKASEALKEHNDTQLRASSNFDSNGAPV